MEGWKFLEGIDPGEAMIEHSLTLCQLKDRKDFQGLLK